MPTSMGLQNVKLGRKWNEQYSCFNGHGVPANKKLNRDILKWAFATRIVRPFQTAAHAGVHLQLDKCYACASDQTANSFPLGSIK